jgi:hypothetical protein
MRRPRTYVLRVYRWGPKRLAGLLENAESGDRQAFSTIAQLWELLRIPASIRAKPRPPGCSTPGATTRLKNR